MPMPLMSSIKESRPPISGHTSPGTSIALRFEREWLLDAVRQMIRRAMVEDGDLVREIIRGLGYLRTAEAARYCGVSTDTLRRAIRRRDLPHIDKGHRTKLVRICDLDAWLARFRRKSRFDG